MEETFSFSPERNLLIAILRRALFDYVGGPPIEKAAAKEWFFEEDTSAASQFSFRWVCWHLGFEAESILRRLNSVSPAIVKASKSAYA